MDQVKMNDVWCIFFAFKCTLCGNAWFHSCTEIKYVLYRERHANSVIITALVPSSPCGSCYVSLLSAFLSILHIWLWLWFLVSSYLSNFNYDLFLCQDTIHTVYYFWALQQMEQEERGEDGIYLMWRLREMQQQGIQALI